MSHARKPSPPAPVHIRLTDPLPLRGLASGLVDLLLVAAEPGGQLEAILESRPCPDALVVIALTAERAVGAAVATAAGELVTVVEVERHAAQWGELLREKLIPAAGVRWPGWGIRRATHAA